MGRIAQLRKWAGTIKRDVVALYVAARDARTLWYVKVAAAAVAAYALSPIDLIPDFIPIIGYLDDLLIVPLGIALVVRLIPIELMAAFRAEADRRTLRPTSYVAAVLIGCVWLLALAGSIVWIQKLA